MSSAVPSPANISSGETGCQQFRPRMAGASDNFVATRPPTEPPAVGSGDEAAGDAHIGEAAMRSGPGSRLTLAVLLWMAAVPVRAQTSDVLFGGWSWRSADQGSRPAGLG